MKRPRLMTDLLSSPGVGKPYGSPLNHLRDSERMDGPGRALFEPDAAHDETWAYGGSSSARSVSGAGRAPPRLAPNGRRGAGSVHAYPSLIFCRHGRQKTSRPGVGWNGTVVEAPHAEQTAW